MKPNKKNIIAWIDNSSLRDYIIENNSEGVDYDAMLRDTDLVYDLDNKIDEIWDEAFSEGKSNADIMADHIDEVSDLVQEEIGVNFVVEKFKDCKTLEEFSDRVQLYLFTLAKLYEIMKFTIKQSELLTGIKVVYPAIKQSVVIPICETIKFEVAEDQLRLTATNIQVELSTTIKNDFKAIGSFCLPGVKLYNLVSNLAEQPLEISTTEKIATIKTANGKYELPISDPVDFPIFKVEPDKSISIDAELFQKGIKKTIFACSNDEKKPQQTGVFIEINKGKILFTATDSHRVNHIEHPTKSKLQASLIIPASSLKLLPEIDGELNISFGANSLSVTGENATFKSTLIDAEFPDYRSVIPKNDKVLTIDRKMFQGAIKRVSGFSNFATNLLKLQLGDKIIISGQNVDYSEYGEEELKAEYPHEEMAIGLSAELLPQSLNSLDSNVVYILLSEPNRAVLIKEELQSDDYILIMPMFLEG